VLFTGRGIYHCSGRKARPQTLGDGQHAELDSNPPPHCSSTASLPARPPDMPHARAPSSLLWTRDQIEAGEAQMADAVSEWLTPGREDRQTSSSPTAVIS
jgi:hypothetical protein